MAEAALNKVWREALGPAEVDAAMAETEAATSSAEPAATSSAEPAAPSLPPPPGTNCQNLIKAALTDEPMLPEAVHAAMVEIAAGAYAVPPLKVVQTSLSARGENYAKKVTERGRTCWMKYPEGEGPEKLAPKKKKKKPARPTKLTAKQMAAEAAKPFPKGGKGKDVVKLEKKVDFGALRRRSEDLISKPMSAFMLFGFSQRGALKTHGTTTVKEIVKAVGERWLLLGDEERAKYEVMAKEEVKYCEKANARRAAEKEKAAKEALAFFDAKQAAKAKAAKEAMAAAAAAALAEQGPDDEDEEEDEVEEGGGAEPDEGGVVEPDEDAVMEEADAGEAPVEEEGADDVLGEEDPSSFLPSPDGALGASPEGGVVLPSPEGAVGDFV